MKFNFASNVMSLSLIGLVGAVLSLSCTNKSTDKPSVTANGGSGGPASGAGGVTNSAGGDAGGASGASACSSPPGTGQAIAPAWDWTGVVGTGQSLAVGQYGMPVNETTQPYGNLKLSTGSAAWPLDPSDPTFTMVPLIEPIGRLATGYPSAYPTNIAGETPHAAMANQITALYQQAAPGKDYVAVHGEFGENGQCLTYLVKNAVPMGVNGRAYAATLMETQAITRLAQAAGKTYGVAAITVTHGECDAGNASYETALHQLWSDYNTDIPAITGQTQKLLMIVSQQNSVVDSSASTLAQWKIGVDYPSDEVCSGPKYQYPYHEADHIHLETDGYERLGEKYAQVYFERVVLGHAWQPLQPTSVEHAGALITVHFHVPVLPLVWDSTFQAPHQDIAEWKDGKGFEVTSSAGRETIVSVDIACDSVQITIANASATNLVLGYAMIGATTAMSSPFVGTFRWGLLRDSDLFVGSVTKKAQPNYAVAFQLPVP
jgi:lysophospholipase L1-like esterase